MRSRWIRRNRVKAVYEGDLERFLLALGVLDDVVKGTLQCALCGTTISLSNLGAVYPDGGAVRVVCERLACLAAIEGRKTDKS